MQPAPRRPGAGSVVVAQGLAEGTPTGASDRSRPLSGYDQRIMCRNIRTLHNFEPPATADEIGASALQYVRKISGCTKPSKANAEAFEDAVDEVTRATRRLLDRLVSGAPPRNRDEEARKARERWKRRAERMASQA